MQILSNEPFDFGAKLQKEFYDGDKKILKSVSRKLSNTFN